MKKPDSSLDSFVRRGRVHQKWQAKGQDWLEARNRFENSPADKEIEEFLRCYAPNVDLQTYIDHVGFGQRELLQYAMRRFRMTQKEFSARLGVKYGTLNNWLAEPGSTNFRPLSLMGWKFVTEILNHRNDG